MAEEKTLTAEKNPEKKLSKNTFPRVSLNKVLPLAEAIYELGEGDPVPRLIVFDKLGKSPESGPSRMLITTSNAYGLTTGSYQAERLGITEKGKAIVTSQDPVKTRGHAVQLLLSNDLFKAFYEKLVNKALPTEPMGIDYLKQVGLSGSDAKVAYDVFVENMNTYGFIKELSGSKRVIPLGMIEADFQEDNQQDNKSDKNNGADNEIPSRQTNDEKAKQDTPVVNQVLTPQFNFNIQIAIPDNASKETYDNIFKSIAENLLKQYDK